ncbi:MAG: hypothetical protein CMJ46_14840 [Planctomyces sp.]|nr:hypothetical protein [Planctomyces sp.]
MAGEPDEEEYREDAASSVIKLFSRVILGALCLLMIWGLLFFLIEPRWNGAFVFATLSLAMSFVGCILLTVGLSRAFHELSRPANIPPTRAIHCGIITLSGVFLLTLGWLPYVLAVLLRMI